MRVTNIDLLQVVEDFDVVIKSILFSFSGRSRLLCRFQLTIAYHQQLKLTPFYQSVALANTINTILVKDRKKLSTEAKALSNDVQKTYQFAKCFKTFCVKNILS